MTEQKATLNPLILILGLSGLFFVLFLGVSAFFLSSSFWVSNSVGVVELSGIILDSKKTMRKLEKFEEDDQIQAVVLRLNSPGGAVAPSQEIFQAVKAYSKPIVVSMGSVAASGAYYIACGAQKIYANPGSLTGSIGVIMEFADLQKLYEWAKVQRYVIKTGAFKDVGADYRTMTAEERDLLQKVIDDVGLQFKQAVSEARKLPMAQVSGLADGRIFSGRQAKELRLVDELGSIKDAIQAAARLAKISGKPNVVYADKKKNRGFLDLLFDEEPLSEVSESLEPFSQADSFWKRLIQRVFKAKTLNESEFLPGIYWIWRKHLI